MQSISLTLNLHYPDLQPVGVMWASRDQLQSRYDSWAANMPPQIKEYLKTTSGDYIPDYQYSKALCKPGYDRVMLIYPPKKLSLRVAKSMEDQFYLNHCHDCNYRYSQKCPGGIAQIHRCFSHKTIDYSSVRIEADLPWTIVGLNVNCLPSADTSPYDAEGILYLHTPALEYADNTLGLALRTGNTNSYGKLCMGSYLDRGDPLGELFRSRRYNELDAAKVVALSLGREFNTDYTVPEGTTASWLTNLRTLNTPEKMLGSEYYWGAMTILPSTPGNAFSCSPTESLLSFVKFTNGNVAIKTTERYFLPSSNTSLTHAEFHNS